MAKLVLVNGMSSDTVSDERKVRRVPSIELRYVGVNVAQILKLVLNTLVNRYFDYGNLSSSCCFAQHSTLHCLGGHLEVLCPSKNMLRV